MNVFDYMALYSLGIIWIIIFVNIILVVFGYIYYSKVHNKIMKEKLKYYPFVSVMVPAHNEAIVIRKTVESLLELDYPHDRYEIIIINDNSSDNSAEILQAVKEKVLDRNLIIINTDNITGGKGKSNALNIGLEKSKGEILAVYDADNTPDSKALKYLVQTLLEDDKLGAVIGKFRCRNKDKNLLTNFINIETLTYQWMAQAGRWEMFKLCTIPGTNFVVRRSIMEEMNGWDTKAITEDTEVSFRIYMMGYKIKFMPLAVTYEQEPQTLNVWFKQRIRWAKGNTYVVIKNFKYLFKPGFGVTKFDILYYTMIYFFFLSASVISDMLFLLGFGDIIQINITGYGLILWVMAYSVFNLSIMIAISTEKGELNIKNIMVISIMYFTYCKLWAIVAAIGFYNYIRDSLLKRETKWYKTERF
ncbi:MULTISPECIES: glycosyltransferase [unclassified Clostridium]|uniref:Beta-monoglucosyldiacylglycerol synthase n=1 Tax=Clostridium botulinum (strain Eklund 17B / Type B) TaxID=935198 RepID=B2TL29_CLOBB|nr:MULTISPECIES: glycosyltransferase [unclassified Clostridium]ACD21919.1 N-acetyllactosaminide beta-1,6-N-acetylglucosaminyl-transferase [Clostridium botulinum B str. Eklund 17B (NRP)]MBY6974489.1 glycosyltransferase family 2 protein [Clostridium botulinum]MBY6999475.1 glycosyltransferase family 2 protein [Clostridium botulinum]MCR1275304.1 glycosyltransferase family 2 protein [Clostridium botulinum]NFD71173.1 glycosyltransferase family 2 protein [Clostridium botulinum]